MPPHINPCPPNLEFVARRVQTDGTEIAAIDRTSYDGIARITTGASITPFSINAWLTRLTTGGTGGVEQIGPAGSPGFPNYGARFIYALFAKANPNDSVAIDPEFFTKGGVPVASITMDAVSEYIVCEGTPAGWEIIYSAPGVVT